MIKYNNSNINDWYFDTSDIIKVYRNNAVCYYKVSSTSPTAQTPCYAVVNDISQYSDTEFEDVFNLADEKWYKLNNLNQYEEYGVYGSGRTSCGGSSRLPEGYTEVEYIESSGSQYINTGVYLNKSSFEVGYVLDGYPSGAQWGYVHQNVVNGAWVTVENNLAYMGRWSTNGNYDLKISAYTSSTQNTIIYNNSGVQVNGTTLTKSLSLTTTDNIETIPLHFFARYDFYKKGLEYSSCKFKSFYVKNGGTLVMDFVPAKRNSDNKYGMYDLVSDTFYLSPNGNDFLGGKPIVQDCVTTYEGKLTIDGNYEYIYSGGSWVNVGEVSGGTIETVWLDYPSSNNVNAKFNIGHYWGENYKMVCRVYISGSYNGDRGSFWLYDTHTPIEFSFYANGFYYDFHNPTSTTAPDVYTGDYSWRIMKNNTLRSYENSQILDFTLTNGTVEVKLEETGVAVVTGSTSVTAQNWYNGLYQASIGIMSNYNRCHLSSIKIYNGNDELVNDLKFIKNNTTGSQEISMYDSVLNVTYNNTNSNTPTYHIVEESGGTTYPVYYDEIQDPPDNLTFNTMTEAEAYECPWVGMTATIDGDKYVFSGDSQSGYEWVYNPSRLPNGYTEVEYVQNTTHAYLDIGFIPNQDTRIVCDMQQVTINDFPRLWGAGEWNSANGINLNYEGGYLQMSWFGKTSWTQITSVTTNNDKHTYDLNKNYLYVDETLVGSNTYTTKTAAASIGIFCEIRNNGQPPTSGNNPQYWSGEYFKGKMYSFKVYDNGTLVRDLVPCIKDSDNTVGAYDLVNDVFYTVPTGYTTDKLIAGDPV